MSSNGGSRAATQGPSIRALRRVSVSADRRNPSERALHLLDAVALDGVALPHVLVALEGHAAFLPGAHLARVVLEPLELRELALVDDDVVADQADIGAAFDHPVGDAAARHLPDLGDGEDLEDDG